VDGALSSLVVGERIVSRCEDGLLLAEYALFDPAEVMLLGNPSQGVREQGFFTTAERARERLHAAGITPEIVIETFRSMRPRLMRALARSPSVLLAIDRLGPYEAFEGGTFRASTRTYQGAWLDLDALVTACPLRDTAELLQAMHLREVLDEVADDVPVRLLTANATESLRVGERTWRAIAFDSAPRLPSVLNALRVPRKKAIDEEGEIRESLLRNLRSRSAGAKLAEPRIRSLATLVARTGKTPAPAHSDEAMATPVVIPTPRPLPIDLRLREASLADVDPLDLFEELRGHTQLLKGEDHLRAVAQYLSSMAGRSPSQPELGVLASRAWLAAGEPTHARHFARLVAENVSAADAVRLLALEIIETTSNEQSLPPPPVEDAPIVPMPILLAAPHQQFAPSGASLPPVSRMPSEEALPAAFVPPPALVPSFDAVPPAVTASRVLIVEAQAASPPVEPTAPLVLAEATPEPPPEPAVVPVAPPHAGSEIVESLALPDGLSDAMLPPGAKPRTPAQARIAMTRLSRWLGRDYRLWYGTTLMTSVIAIEAMQRHLRRRFDDKAVATDDAEKVEWELMRHGALLSEILARSLGGAWVDVPADRPGHWAMVLYPGIRVWPIGRIYRFFQQGHREADLVAYYLDLEAQVRRSA
jgi:hypothetical protein